MNQIRKVKKGEETHHSVHLGIGCAYRLLFKFVWSYASYSTVYYDATFICFHFWLFSNLEQPQPI